MFSSRFVWAFVLTLGLGATGHAEAVRPASKRLPDWLDALLRQIDAGKVQYESITLTVPEEVDAKSDQAKVEVISPERFWRLASLVELRSGAANMKNLTSAGGPRRSAAEFDVALDAPVIREGDLDKLRTASEDLAQLVQHMQADPAVHVTQVLLSRPAEISVFGRAVRRVPVRVALLGPRAELLSRVSELAKPLPYAYLRGLRATPGTALEVAVSINLLVKTADAVKIGSTVEELAKQVGERVAATAGPDVKVTNTSGASGDAVILAIAGPARDANGARDALLSLVKWPGLKGYDELGWKNDDGKVALTGLLHFAR